MLEVILKALGNPRRFECFRVLIVSIIPFGDRLRRILIFYVQIFGFFSFGYFLFFEILYLLKIVWTLFSCHGE